VAVYVILVRGRVLHPSCRSSQLSVGFLTLTAIAAPRPNVQALPGTRVVGSLELRDGQSCLGRYRPQLGFEREQPYPVYVYRLKKT